MAIIIKAIGTALVVLSALVLIRIVFYGMPLVVAIKIVTFPAALIVALVLGFLVALKL
jgi:hypothetical protein